MTLVEAVVVVTILSILSTMTVVSFPVVRSHQDLISDAGQIEAVLRDAQLRALNEVRPDECVIQAGPEPEQQRLCSNVGVAVQSGKAVLFSDSSGDRAYTPAEDFEINEYVLKSQVSEANPPQWRVFVFEADPPTIAVYENGAVVLPASSEDQTPSLTLQAGKQERKIFLQPYGIIE